MQMSIQHSSGDTLGAEELRALYQITEEDLAVIRAFGKNHLVDREEYVMSFYVWLRKRPEFEAYFSDPEKLDRVQRGQILYWDEFFEGRIDETYVQKRRKVGEIHAIIGLPLQVYFAAMDRFLCIGTEEIQRWAEPRRVHPGRAGDDQAGTL